MIGWLTTKVSGPVADWRGLESHCGGQLEGWGVERQELSGGENHHQGNSYYTAANS